MCSTSISDPRLSLICLKESVGGAGARNVGIRAAQGDWIAFLDDDDEWLPEKIRKQLEVAANADCVFLWFPAACMRARLYGQHVLAPSAALAKGEAVSEYIMARRSLFQGEGTITTTTLLVPKELLMRCPVRRRTAAPSGMGLALPERCNPQTPRSYSPPTLSPFGISTKIARPLRRWQELLRYSFREMDRSMPPTGHPRAYAAFLLTLVTSIAARAGDWRYAYVVILRQAIRHAAALRQSTIFFSAAWSLFPQEYRRRIRAVVGRMNS